MLEQKGKVVVYWCADLISSTRYVHPLRFSFIAPHCSNVMLIFSLHLMSIGPYAWQIVIRTIRLRRHAWRFSRYLLANPIFKTIQFSTRFWPIQACVGSWKETMIDVSSCFYYEGCNLLVFISLIQPFTAMDRLNYHRSITSEYPPLRWWCWCAASDGAERGRKCLC